MIPKEINGCKNQQRGRLCSYLNGTGSQCIASTLSQFAVDSYSRIPCQDNTITSEKNDNVDLTNAGLYKLRPVSNKWQKPTDSEERARKEPQARKTGNH